MQGIERDRKANAPMEGGVAIMRIVFRYSDGREVIFVPDAARENFSEDDILELKPRRILLTPGPTAPEECRIGRKVVQDLAELDFAGLSDHVEFWNDADAQCSTTNPPPRLTKLMSAVSCGRVTVG